MTIERLEQYKSICLEEAELKKRLATTEARANRRYQSITSATVQGSSPYLPYQKRTLAVRGYQVRRVKLVAVLENQYKRKHLAALQEAREIEEWLDTVQDMRLRRLVRYRYVEGLSWRATATRVYGHPCEDAARKYVERHVD